MSEPGTRWTKKKIVVQSLIGVVVVFFLLFAVVAVQPDSFRVARSITINAPAGEVFPHVNKLKSWEPWSPFEKLDPEMKKTFEGPASGVRAKSSWVGNANVGEGSTTIIESRPNELVRITLEMRKPFAGANDVKFTFKSDGDQTLVTWEMTGKLSFLPKAVHLVIGMDRMVGGQFETGLASLKSLVEAPAKSDLNAEATVK